MNEHQKDFARGQIAALHWALLMFQAWDGHRYDDFVADLQRRMDKIEKQLLGVEDS